jgi:hypothetical protein
MLVLSLTGIVLYVIPIVKKRTSKKNRQGAAKPALAAARRPLPQKAPAMTVAAAVIAEPIGAE